MGDPWKDTMDLGGAQMRKVTTEQGVMRLEIDAPRYGKDHPGTSVLSH